MKWAKYGLFNEKQLLEKKFIAALLGRFCFPNNEHY